MRYYRSNGNLYENDSELARILEESSRESLDGVDTWQLSSS